MILTMVLFSCNSTKKSSKKENNEVTKKEQVNKPKTAKLQSSTYTVNLLNGNKSLAKSPTMIFDFEKNSIHGNASCNTYGGNMIITNDKIKFERLMGTKMYCKDFMHIEKEFLNTLTKSHHFKMEKNKFFLYDKANTLLLVGVEND